MGRRSFFRKFEIILQINVLTVSKKLIEFKAFFYLLVLLGKFNDINL